MIKIEMTGICKDCDKADLYLWDSKYSQKMHVACKNEDVCKRVEMLCKSKAEGKEE